MFFVSKGNNDFYLSSLVVTKYRSVYKVALMLVRRLHKDGIESFNYFLPGNL